MGGGRPARQVVLLPACGTVRYNPLYVLATFPGAGTAATGAPCRHKCADLQTSKTKNNGGSSEDSMPDTHCYEYVCILKGSYAANLGGPRSHFHDLLLKPIEDLQRSLCFFLC